MADTNQTKVENDYTLMSTFSRTLGIISKSTYAPYSLTTFSVLSYGMFIFCLRCRWVLEVGTNHATLYAHIPVTALRKANPSDGRVRKVAALKVRH